MELKLENKICKLLVILQNYLTGNYRKLPVTLMALLTLIYVKMPPPILYTISNRHTATVRSDH